jgi:hypothetical protein
MNLKRTSAFAGAAACALTLGFTSLASADASSRTMANTFPVANKLCTEVKAGGGNAKLKAEATQIIADCTTLETKFQELTKTAIAGQTVVRTALAADKVAFKTACPKVISTRAACRIAKRTLLLDKHRLSLQRFSVDFTFLKGLEAARLAFWTSVRSLPGGAHLKADAVINPPTPPKGAKTH